MCYYGGWATYRPGHGKVDPDDIDPQICTHILYAFTVLNSDYTIKVKTNISFIESMISHNSADVKALLFLYVSNCTNFLPQVHDPWADLADGGGLDGFGKVVGLKSQNPALKVLIAVGGWNAGSTIFSQMASTSANRQSFINSAVDLVMQYNFDGLDMDWEYPAKRGGVPADKVLSLYSHAKLFNPISTMRFFRRKCPLVGLFGPLVVSLVYMISQ